MIDINKEIEKISSARFFSCMGLHDIDEDHVIHVDDVKKIFIEPTEFHFNGLYKDMKWLPTSPTQNDPFYKKCDNPKDLIELRIQISKHVMDSIKNFNKEIFISPPHDFSSAARNAIGFAFRQLITERYFGLGCKWQMVVSIYYAGHWPVGYTNDKFIVI